MWGGGRGFSCLAWMALQTEARLTQDVTLTSGRGVEAVIARLPGYKMTRSSAFWGPMEPAHLRLPPKSLLTSGLALE